MTRILLFLATNFAVIMLISLVFNILGLDGIQTASGGLDLGALLVMSAVIGFGGSFISLAMSKWSAKRAMNVQIIEQPGNATEQWLLKTVASQAQQAGIKMPEVGIFPSNSVNAFATGMNRNAALVAVSSGLLNQMTQDEAEAVLGHEVSHVANGDMVTMGLMQGVVNTFVVFLSRIVGFFVDRVILKNDRGLGIGYFISSMVAQVFLSIFASMIVMWFSRYREFRADEGGAALAGKHKMIAALKRLQNQQEVEMPGELAAFGISPSAKKTFSKLLLSHPPLEQRIAALENSQEI